MLLRPPVSSRCLHSRCSPGCSASNQPPHLTRSSPPWQPFLRCRSTGSSHFGSSPSTTPSTSPHPRASPTTLHTSLPTFLAHARRTALPTSAPTFIGTFYEYAVLRTLRRLGFDLSRTGGRGDGGVDAVGVWHLRTTSPTGANTKSVVDVASNATAGMAEADADTTAPPPAPQAIKVLLQAKFLTRGPSPSLIRELEGAFAAAPAGWRGRRSAVGVLVSTRPATKGVREAMMRSRWGCVWVCVEVKMPKEAKGKNFGNGEEGGGGRENGGEAHGEDESLVLDPGLGQGRIKQMLWNRAASEIGLEGWSVVTQYSDSSKSAQGGGKVDSEVVLMYTGQRVRGLDE